MALSVDTITVEENLKTGHYNIGDSGSSKTIDWNTANHQTITLTANCTLTFTAPTPGYCHLMLRVIQNGTGGYDITWPSGLLWMSGVEISPTSAADSEDIFSFLYTGSYYTTAIQDFQEAP